MATETEVLPLYGFQESIDWLLLKPHYRGKILERLAKWTLAAIVVKILCMARHKLCGNEPMPVAKAFCMASIFLGVGIPVSIGMLLALFGWAVDPLVGSLAWDPFLTFVADSYLSVGLSWVGLGVITLLLFLAALLGVKDYREATSSAFEIHHWLLRRSSKLALSGFMVAPLYFVGCPCKVLTKGISSGTLISAVLTTLVASVGITSIARRLQKLPL